MIGWPAGRPHVALRKESVDRNLYYGDDLTFADGSLSARRAWIEMALPELIPLTDPVALRKESVDRNFGGACGKLLALCRSPQGERG